MDQLFQTTTKKTTARADRLEAQFHPAKDPSHPAVIKIVDLAMRLYQYDLVNEPKLTSLSEASQAIRRLETGKAPSPNSLHTVVS